MGVILGSSFDYAIFLTSVAFKNGLDHFIETSIYSVRPKNIKENKSAWHCISNIYEGIQCVVIFDKNMGFGHN